MTDLTVTRAKRIRRYPTDGILTCLIIDGTAVFDDLLDRSCRGSLRLALSTVVSLEVRLLAECAWKFRDPFVLDIFFTAIRRMGHLQQLTIEGFSVSTPDAPPPPPICLFRSPIPIDHLIIHNTHGASLRFLLDCFEPEELLLESCWFITNIPDCDRLTLRRIEHFAGFAEVLAGWDGDELVVDSCPFLNERFVAKLRQVAVDTGEPLWQYTNVELQGYGYTIRRRIELLQN